MDTLRITKKKWDWIVIDTVVGHYKCQRCGYSVPAPTTMMSFEMMLSLMNAFIKAHKDCKEKS